MMIRGDSGSQFRSRIKAPNLSYGCGLNMYTSSLNRYKHRRIDKSEVIQDPQGKYSVRGMTGS
jgi:hypothetical protein